MATEIDKTNGNKKKLKIELGDHVVVRTKNAGVHFGRLVEREDPGAAGGYTVLADARRIWEWAGAFTLSAVAKHGVGPGSKVSCEVEFVELPETIERLLSSARVGKILAEHEHVPEGAVGYPTK